MTVQQQISRLKNEIATLKAAIPLIEAYEIGGPASANLTMVDLQHELAALEKQDNDPHQYAKERIEFWKENNVQLEVVAYVRHLENELDKRPVVWCANENGKMLNGADGHPRLYLSENAGKNMWYSSTVSIVPYTGEQQCH